MHHYGRLDRVVSYLALLLVASAVFLISGIEGAEAYPVKKVLVVHSYHEKYEWVAAIDRGINHVLFGNKGVEYQTLYMDTKRNPSEDFKQKAGEEARMIIDQWKPDMLITIDDNAQEYVGKHYVGKNGMQVVFAGVNGTLDEYGYDSADNVTGLLERPKFQETYEAFRYMVPSAKRIAVISDSSPTSKKALAYMQNVAKKEGVPVVAWQMPQTFGQWQQAVKDRQADSDALLVYVYHTVKNDTANEIMEPKKVMEWTVENSKIPVIGLLEFAVDDGALFGIVESGIEHGKGAATMIENIAIGVDMKQLPVKYAVKGTTILNMKALKKWGITLSDDTIQSMDIIIGE